MITPNPTDLRIGNILQAYESGTYLKVVEIRTDGNTTYVMDRSKFPLPDGWQARGVPLTNNILTKCGFRQWDDGLTWSMDTTDGFIHICGTGFYLGGEHSCTNLHTFRNGGLLYLHQLQNLVYTLTGTELQITL